MKGVESGDERKKKEKRRLKELENAESERPDVSVAAAAAPLKTPSTPKNSPGSTGALWGGGVPGGVRQGDSEMVGAGGLGSEGGLDLYGVKGDTWYVGLAVIHQS